MQEALLLRQQLDDAYSAMECRKALAICGGDLQAAARWLVSGAWQAAKLVSWNWESLHAKSAELAQELDLSADECLRTLKNCSGSLVLARRVLCNLPLLQPSAAAGA